MTLTNRQQQALDAIHAHLREHRCYPSMRELGIRMGIASPHGITQHVKGLRKKGYLTPAGKIRLANQSVCLCCGQKISTPARELKPERPGIARLLN